MEQVMAEARARGLVEQAQPQPQARNVDPGRVIDTYRQRCADLEFELYKTQALLAEQDEQVAAFQREIANLRAMRDTDEGE